MCGILGWIESSSSDRLSAFRAALDTLAHRGPDDSGVYEAGPVLFGHRRLSIIDLTENGHQPMLDPASGAVVVFNGEIYNYLELRRELENSGVEFRTDSDTEVLLHAYLRWGSEALRKFNGMWSLAIWQPASNKVFVARDRFGVKPFYYIHQSGRFAFASEPKALLQLFPEKRTPNDLAVYRFLAEGKLYTDAQSFYQDIAVLPAACCAEYDLASGRLIQQRYWDYPDHTDPWPGDWPEAVEAFTSLFDDAVSLRMRSDVPVGVTLSGGLDSTAVIASAMRSQGPERVCLTSVYGERDRGEARWAETALRPYGMVPVQVEAPKHGWLDTLNAISWHMDAPGYSPAVYPLWHLMREARRRGVYVLLEGQGADEALGGYPQYAILALQEKLRHVRSTADVKQVRQAWGRMCATFTRRWAILWLLRESFPALAAWNRQRSGSYLALSAEFRQAMERQVERPATVDDRSMDAVTKRLLQDHSKAILPGLLHYGDAISMAHGVESRLPFLDYRLVEWLFRHDATMKIREGETKWVLRQYLRGAGQAGIAERKDKMGYPTPVERWILEDDAAMVRELLLVPEARVRRFCSRQGLEQLLLRHQAGHAGAGHHLYRLISTELWMRRCL